MEMFPTSSSSDMLIIRHGRSRVRHSSEKDHIRWGLKAFDLGKLITVRSHETTVNLEQRFLFVVYQRLLYY